MLSKNVGGKFKYLNQKNSEFFAGNLNAKWKRGKGDKGTRGKGEMQNAKFHPNLKFSPKHKIFAQT